MALHPTMPNASTAIPKAKRAVPKQRDERYFFWGMTILILGTVFLGLANPII